MGFKDFLKGMVGDSDDEFEDIYEDNYKDENTFGIEPPRSRDREQERERQRRERDRGRRDDYVQNERPRRRHESDKVVNIHTTTQLQVVLANPDKYEEAAAIADNLSHNRAVVLNIERTNRDEARRLLDFLTGAAYASNGQIKRVSNGTYLITPYNVDVMGDLLDELENNGMFG
ncbi:MAG: cell division protein SepF [Eubacterium sp.]|nr:cell division protein SepF [Eubacterium sp.]